MRIIILLKDIYKSYKNGEETLNVINGINFEIIKGDFISIIGKSGSGKTTLLNIIGMIDVPDKGEYFFDGESITNLSASKLAKFRAEKFGFVFQSFNLIEELDAFENIEMPLGYSGMKKKQRSERVMELLKGVGLIDKQKSKPYQLSGGQQQRIAIARALAGDPSVIIADEPTGNLDIQSRDDIINLLLNLNKNGKTIILVTHDMDIASISKKMYRIENCRITSL